MRTRWKKAPGTIATGVTGLQLYGVDIGTQLPMTFATTHPRQVRRRDVQVRRLKQLPPHRDGIARAVTPYAGVDRIAPRPLLMIAGIEAFMAKASKELPYAVGR